MHGGSRTAQLAQRARAPSGGWDREEGGSSDEWASESPRPSPSPRIFVRHDASARSGGESDGRSLHALAVWHCPRNGPPETSRSARAPALRCAALVRAGVPSRASAAFCRSAALTPRARPPARPRGVRPAADRDAVRVATSMVRPWARRAMGQRCGRQEAAVLAPFVLVSY